MAKREGYDLLEVLDAIDPAALDYQGWASVGMALKYEGFDVSVWDDWSRRDGARYHSYECENKWHSFQCDTANPVTGGTLVSFAKAHGWEPSIADSEPNTIMGWDDVIDYDEPAPIIDPAWLESEDVVEPSADAWQPSKDIITYLETLFEASETVGFVTKSWEKDGRYLPTSGQYHKTAGELIEQISKCKGDIGAVLGDYNPEAGAWIRFNPLDGQGVKNSNVTEFRYALVESDSMDIDKQIAIVKQLELPVACLVHSGNKSVHAIVKVDAPDYNEYRKRVDYLYSVCKKNGLDIDSQNKNPSRLSRMPGVYRKGVKQYLIATSIGKPNWAAWYDWNEEINDGLPEITTLADEWSDPVEQSDVIIEGMLERGDKMMIAGPSKSGKSFALIELCVAFAEGGKWFGQQCTQGDILYINFELRKKSRKRRLKAVYSALGIAPKNINRIKSLDLRGYSAPLKELTRSIIRRASGGNYVAIVLDPIYKIMAGDENSAEDVGEFCNELDHLALRLNCALIYCHHYSKGPQGQKSSIDRASGSGVFVRDADLIINMTELTLDEKKRQARFNTLGCELCIKWLDIHGPNSWRDQLQEQDDIVVLDRLRIDCTRLLSTADMNALIGELDTLDRACNESLSAWRIESTVREFKTIGNIDLWFEYPLHIVDDSGVLSDIKLEEPKWSKPNKSSSKGDGKEKKNNQELQDEFKDAVVNANFGEPATRAQIMQFLNMSSRTTFHDRLSLCDSIERVGSNRDSKYRLKMTEQ